MGAEPVRIPEAARSLYHTALAHGANNLVTLVADCAELLGRAEIGDSSRLLAPLLSAALDNALRRGDRALTGPVARGDVDTVRSHLRVLAEGAPEFAPSYRILASRTLVRAKGAGLLAEPAAVELGDLLGDATSRGDEP